MPVSVPTAHHLVIDPLIGYFGFGAFMYALFGVAFLVLWWRDREPGLHLVGVAALLSASFNVGEAMGWVLNPTKYLAPTWSAIVVAASLMLWTSGLAIYAEPRRWMYRWSTWIAVGPEAVLIALESLHVPVLRVVGNLIYYLSFLTMVPVVWGARRREPGAGHELLAATLLIMPIAIGTFLVFRVDIFYLRHVAIPCLMVFNVALLVVSVYRRRTHLSREVARRTQAEQDAVEANRLLREANATLETRVEERTQILREVVAGLESFNRNLSHDLRGPLGGIQGVAGLLRSNLAKGTETPEKADRKLRLIEDQARQSYELVDAMLELAHVSNTALTRETIAMESLVKDVLESLTSLTSSAATQPQFEVHPLPVIDADPVLAKVVLTNLISNAIKFSRARPDAQVQVSAEAVDGVWVFSVQDNGPGFEPAAAATLFEPFKRLHGKEIAGHGVGLSIVRRIVERHGGRVWAVGNPGSGACFSFTLAPATS